MIEYTRGRSKRVQHYRALLRIARSTLDYLQQAAGQLPLAAGPAGKLWQQAQVRHYQPLITQIIAQTERRVLAGEAVPPGEKLVSLFEPHADIIVKGSRDVDYGHKLNLTTGRSGRSSISSTKPAIQPTASGSCPYWSATSPSVARRRGRRPPTAAMRPVKTCARPSPGGCGT